MSGLHSSVGGVHSGLKKSSIWMFLWHYVAFMVRWDLMPLWVQGCPLLVPSPPYRAGGHRPHAAARGSGAHLNILFILGFRGHQLMSTGQKIGNTVEVCLTLKILFFVRFGVRTKESFPALYLPQILIDNHELLVEMSAGQSKGSDGPHLPPSARRIFDPSTKFQCDDRWRILFAFCTCDVAVMCALCRETAWCSSYQRERERGRIFRKEW